MKRYLSPLRYPGGKARFSPFIASLIRTQPFRATYYAEPFAGGAGAALSLLADEVVKAIFINDLSPCIAAFWRAQFFHTDALAGRIERAVVTVEEWRIQREIFMSPAKHDDLTLGYATFFLNRCNRSGILDARPIGRLDQAGKWKIDARFNRKELADRVRYLGGFKRRVHVSQQDGREFLESIEHFGKQSFVYVDPPYIGQGDGLYMNSLSESDHLSLASQLLRSSCPWMLTYDVSDKISSELYSGLRIAQFNIAHTAQRQHVGSELLVFSNDLNVDSIQVLAGANAAWIVD